MYSSRAFQLNPNACLMSPRLSNILPTSNHSLLGRIRRDNLIFDKQPRNIRNLAFPFTARHSNLFSSTILNDFRFVNNNLNFVADLVATLVLIVYSAIAYIPLDPTPSAATLILSGYPMATNSAPTLQ